MTLFQSIKSYYYRMVLKGVNSKLYYHLYYKYTKGHKEELALIKERVLKCKKEIMRK